MLLNSPERMKFLRSVNYLLLENFRAAYKGFADCIRLLLFLDAYRGRQDKEGKYFSRL